ncbi:hypothetical protein BWK59_01790 [Flavobacterium davisii]|uniref:ATPase dynein-related AAA domain-containing protein n=1 Tax=Flavobacterium davisii TaxID=2906077 RepID=A0A246GL79_9FLAO|nr:AAA family ATPase [Flavobacterium davisii]OWP85128.1 hypothetical protein BWK59_01790 [Flavobacterium davisii]
MILSNLNELGIIANKKALEYKNQETILPENFKIEFTKLLNEKSSDQIIFQNYTAIVTTSKELKIILPNQWFYLASFFYQFLNAIWVYKQILSDLELSSDLIKQLRGNNISDEINSLINTKFSENQDREFFKKFLTDYNWWFGSKTIDRGDFFVSPVLKQANVINETSSYIASLAYFLSLSEKINNLLSLSHNKEEKTIKSNIIYYGAPGTGKSYKIDQEIQNLHPNFYERVTFHPEYDHTNFVGGYRPKSEKNERGEDIITYQFVPQTFTNIYERAWNDTENQYYLVIEEINRGNCAEIFGDIFQLLDRNSNYTVSPSTELKEHLEKVLTNQDGINKGLRLPSNLTIYATMNTSDQSLFPMDSAFKRRWDWEYIPICYDNIPENESFGYKVIIDDTLSFNWIDFLYNVNTIIKTNANLGMDKCIGNYFIKSETKEISLNDFINKAIFYLWNDVFKDEDNTDSIFEKATSYDDFFPINSNGKNLVLRIIEKLNITIENK